MGILLKVKEKFHLKVSVEEGEIIVQEDEIKRLL